jgi:hypothetical protein
MIHVAEVYGQREIGRFRQFYSEEEQKKHIIATNFFPHSH